jgi:hypothetical protein
MDLHGQIMNLPFQRPADVAWTVAEEQAAKLGHRDARHAAAELANEHTKLLEDFRSEVVKCYELANRLDALNPEESKSFTGTPSERIERQLRAHRVPVFDDGSEV